MPQVTYIQQDGQVRTVEGEAGKTILQIALDHGIPMEHACGGNGFCTTCSCEVQSGREMMEKGVVSPVNEKEQNMGIEGPDQRLGCQTKVQGDITVKIIEL
jgi:2Fe-2S ferredoxin